jgi:hypothetical protein
MRAATILWAILAIAAGTSLFMLKYEVQSQEQRLSGLRKDIVEAQESIHVLKAEWSYLNDPSRLREQAEHHLGLHPLKPNQIVSIASLPMSEPRPDEAPIAQGQAESQPAPVATIPPAPEVTRKTPSAPVKAMPAPLPAPAAAPSKPVRSMSASKTPPTPTTKVAAAKPTPKPAPKTTKIASAKPAPTAHPSSNAAAYPTYPAYPSVSTQAKPAGSGTMSNDGNVMVIKSPALAEPEVASTRVRP